MSANGPGLASARAEVQPVKASDTPRQFAVVTGASTGIGYELAKCCAKGGFDLLIAADEPAIYTAADELRALGVTVQAVEADLATIAGVDELYGAANGRRIDA